MKNHYVSTLRPGARIDDVFLISSKSLGEARNGSPYIRLKLSDRTGSVDAFKWEATEKMFEELLNEDFIRIRGAVKTHDGKLQVTIESFHPCTDEIDPADFVLSSERDPGEMLGELRGIVESVRHPHLRPLLDHFFGDQEFLSRFSKAPAAQKIHHACIGGLMEHSLSVAKLCDLAASHYSGVNRDLLVTGALLHDIGKVDELCWDKAIKYSDSGHFIGHIVRGTMMVESAANGITGFDPLLKLLVTHMIVSHHGEREMGSPKRPKCVEAQILHCLEDMDAKVNIIQRAVGGDVPEGDSELWTERHWVLGRPLFKGARRSTPERASGDSSPADASDAGDDPF